MARWEYISIDTEQLASLGDDGWELVSVAGPVDILPSAADATGRGIGGPLFAKPNEVKKATVYFFKKAR